MLEPTSVNPIWVGLIKILSPILMVGALSVDGTIAYQYFQGLDISKMLITFGALGTVALAAHSLEGLVAGAMAKKQGLNPLRYGLYTFFVGTVAFIDLMDNDQS